MPYLGNNPVAGDHVNNFKVLDDISSYTETFDGSATTIVSTSNNTIRAVEHRFIQGQRVTYTNGGGGNIGGLTTGTAYFVIFDTASTFKLATSASNAASSTAINLSSVGSGSSHTLNAAFDGVNTKFKITYNTGTAARFNNATQLNIAINNVLQKPNVSSISFTEGFAIEDNHKIVFKVAPTSQDIFWGSIIANTLTTFDISDHKIDTFTGDGSTTEFTLSHTPANNESLMVTINGVLQHPSNASTARAYTLIASIIQFTAAPGVGDEIQVRHLGFAGATTADVSGFYGRTGNVVLGSTDHITTGNINAGIVTATSFDGTFSSSIGGSNANFTGIVTAGVFKSGDFDGRNLNISGIATFAGDVSIGGTLTYEDVSNIDSVGIITARNGIDCNGDLDVDGHTNLDNVSIAGVATFADNKPAYFGTDGDFYINHSGSSLGMLNTTGDTLFRNTGGAQYFDCNQISLRIAAGSQTMLNAAPSGVTLYTSNNAKLATTNSGVSISQDLDVDGHTNLDNVSISGVTTSGHLTINGDLTVNDNYPSIYLKDYDSDSDFMIQNQNGTFTIYDSTNNADRFEITSTGIVRSPHYTLQSTSPSLTFNDTNHDSDYMWQNANGLFKIYDNTNGADRFAVNSSGSVFVYGDELYIGDSIIHNGDANTKIRFPAADQVSIETAGTQRFRIDSSGNVGIDEPGTILAKLHVVGGKASGTAYNTAIFAGGQNSTSGSGVKLYLSGCENDPISRGVILESIMTDNSNAHRFSILVGGSSAAPTERFRINSSGEVKLLGNQSTAPGGQLGLRFDKNGTTTINIENLSNSSVNNQARIALRTNNGYAYFSYYNQGELYVSNPESNGYFVYYGNSSSGGSQRLRINSNGRISISGNTTNNAPNAPDGNLHIQDSSAGTVTADADANELILESSGNTGMSILSPGSGESSIYFGNPGTNGQKDAWIKYYHETHSTTANRRALTFRTSGGERLRIHGNGYMSLGSTSAPTKFGIRGSSATTDATMQIVGNGVSTLLLGQNARGGVIRGQGANNELSFRVGGNGDQAAGTGGVEALRINSSGALGLNGANYGTTGQVLTSQGSGSAAIWKTIAQPANISSISGNIFAGSSGQTLTITGQYFETDQGVLNFTQTSDGVNVNVNVTPSSDTSMTVTVPSSVGNNVTAGNAVTIKFTNASGFVGDGANTTVLALPSGGTITTSGNYRIHTFTSSSNFVLTKAVACEYLVVAGGGGGGGNDGGHDFSGGSGGGGAGGYRVGTVTPSANTHTVTVGGGGSGNNSAASGSDGSTSAFGSVSSLGGGGGGGVNTNAQNGRSGGSGGGASGDDGSTVYTGGAGTSGQGNAGGQTGGAANAGGGGGGGAGGIGGGGSGHYGGNGGTGTASSINGSSAVWAGGGGGGVGAGVAASSGGAGGGGAGASRQTSNAVAGITNTGGGGGGAADSNVTSERAGANGGSGIVIVRYDVTNL